LRRGKVRDLSGNGNDGQLYGGPALSFDGTNDYAVCDANVSGAMPYTGYTLSAMVRVSSGASGGGYDGYVIGGVYRPSLNIQLSTGRLTFWTERADGSNLHQQVCTEDLRDSTWHHVVITASPDDGSDIRNGLTLTGWLDGSVCGTASVDDADASLGTYVRGVGAYFGPNGYFDGDIGPLGVWASVLSDAEIAALYADPYDAAVIDDAAEYWELDDGSGDPSGVNGTTLNLTGASWDDGDNLGPNATGKGYEFDADDQSAAVIDASSSIHLADSATGWTWFARIDATTRNRLVTKGSFEATDSAFGLEVSVGHATTNATAWTASPYNSSGSSVAVVYDASNNRITIYVDGADATDSRTDGVGAMTDDETDDYVLANSAPGSIGVTGTYFEAPLFNRPLTATEIARLHYAGRF
jgi:hypothetical protein